MTKHEIPVTEDELHAYVDNELPAERRGDVEAWLVAHPEHAEMELRFDAMLIAPRHLPRHVIAAFDASA